MMKHKVFLTGMAAALLTFGLVFVACDNGSTSDPGIPSVPEIPEIPGTRPDAPVTGQQTLTISGSIYGRMEDDSYVPLTTVTSVTVNDLFSTAPTVTGTNSFSVTIPAADLSKLFAPTKADIADMFDLSGADKITVLPPEDAKFGILEFSANAGAEYETDLSLGIVVFNGIQGNFSANEAEYSYVYVSKDVTIKGFEQVHDSKYTENGADHFYSGTVTVDLSLKEGWNVVEESESFTVQKLADGTYKETGTTKFSVNGILNSAKWYLEED